VTPDSSRRRGGYTVKMPGTVRACWSRAIATASMGIAGSEQTTVAGGFSSALASSGFRLTNSGSGGTP
jgi:hypothetical protein